MRNCRGASRGARRASGGRGRGRAGRSHAANSRSRRGAAGGGRRGVPRRKRRRRREACGGKEANEGGGKEYPERNADGKGAHRGGTTERKKKFFKRKIFCSKNERADEEVSPSPRGESAALRATPRDSSALRPSAAKAVLERNPLSRCVGKVRNSVDTTFFYSGNSERTPLCPALGAPGPGGSPGHLVGGIKPLAPHF